MNAPQHRPSTPWNEAVSVIGILSVLAAAGAYAAATQHVPIVTNCLAWIAWRIYGLYPVLL